ncbi:N-acetyl-beta-glucosaminyl-glycoprotein 4-beta-N-acetylgalactosaminyltransferase 1-like [Enhydra lutris kenyoni]|uniref:N-acetyl-beta-glucosaminyl-glycoprotein 4-beta-N-acetylgalactosaminyltransferase 1-like n=1 Tax=Enhydra lutris kenyoni TaxID=391180 RepID=A0A2Y9KWE6_ENHLU|nr:N-acetyl-beta-glucosaminyl-glycoprotein 4-beta-N-acetylgalactosaminyltransferase 1-like [Enhydra lutris kenyoni]
MGARTGRYDRQQAQKSAVQGPRPSGPTQKGPSPRPPLPPAPASAAPAGERTLGWVALASRACPGVQGMCSRAEPLHGRPEPAGRLAAARGPRGRSQLGLIVSERGRLSLGTGSLSVQTHGSGKTRSPGLGAGLRTKATEETCPYGHYSLDCKK